MSDIKTAGVSQAARLPDAAPARIERLQSKASLEVDRRAELLLNPLSQRASAFRVLRHRLAERGDPRVILVSSAIDGEGKTTCAVNLALALAESGRHRVLLLEANTRRPALASVFGFESPACLLEQLARHRLEPEQPWIVVELPPHGLDVLAARPRPEMRGLHGPTMTAALDSLRAAYDFVIVDTSAILTGLDVPVLDDASDGTILAARARHTRGRLVHDALDQISGKHVLGVVLVDV